MLSVKTKEGRGYNFYNLYWGYIAEIRNKVLAWDSQYSKYDKKETSRPDLYSPSIYLDFRVSRSRLLNIIFKGAEK